MTLGILKETLSLDNRVSISPTIAKNLTEKGFIIFVEKSAGDNALYKDEDYKESGAKIVSRKEIFENADVLIQINPFSSDDIELIQENQVLISQLFAASNTELIKKIAERKATAFSLDAMPRITRAQDMDILSSQNNLSGYKAVLVGANEMTKIFPLMMTAAGTIKPSRVLIYGVGVAGLQAIATAKRLGAIVEATDIRSETKEQTESLGAKFISVENKNEKTEGGYASEASKEFQEKQKEAVNKSLFQADLVITTANIPGKKAPVLISKEQVLQMKNGAVIVDLAAAQGGNCEVSELNKTIEVNGVKVIGTAIAPHSVSNNASELFAKNIYNYLNHLTKENAFVYDLEDEITKDTLIVKQGEILKNY